MSAAERNREPIFDALAPWLVSVQALLEIGSGDATHARFAAQRFPHLRWQASEAPGHYRRLVAALADTEALPLPIALDVRGPWPSDRFDAIYAANVAHIMDWPAVCAMLAGAGRCLSPDGLLCLYGPFIEDDVPLGEGNSGFDQALRRRDASMGLRRLAALDSQAAEAGLRLVARLRMPSDNRLLIWQRCGANA
ncbi:MAG: DUF938 domain-containing protein [Salinisphaera sp.]|nr:DUF938 domain-containing protein [Salinisphaera sp.]